MMYIASALKEAASQCTGYPPCSAHPESISYVNAGDRLLVNRARGGEQRAFNELVGRYRQRVMTLSMRYTGNRADAEDAVQNTFLKAYRALAQFRGDSAFYSWLHRIAINSAKSIRALRIREQRVIQSTNRGAETDKQDLQLTDSDTPEGLVLTEEICQAVNGAIDSLCEEQRNAIVLREFEGLSYSEVAANMGCPIGTVRSRVFRARESIDSRLRVVFDEGLGRARGVALRS